MLVRIATALCLILAAAAPLLEAQSLRGSRASVQKQHRIARQHDLSFLTDAADVQRFVRLGLLVHLPGNRDYALASVSFPYARPAVKTFVERLAAQYRAACGEKLVVTSLTRPERHQPANASDLSVHPAGMAVDLRVSNRASCRNWLDNTLLSLERQNLIDATRETRPPHYHVAVFPQPYLRYVAARTGEQPRNAPDDRLVRAVAAATTYRTRPGDTLWSIARRHGTTVALIQEENGLDSARILPGQVLRIPVDAR
jgi:hypothetical protein